jgi:steroid delta-isomerase-like uncharacterized protein
MDHAATMRRFYDFVNARDVDGFGELMADDFVEHEVIEFPPTKEGVQEFFRAQIAAFSDLKMTVEDVIASGDKVVARIQVTGTNDGDYIGMPATGKAVDVQGIDIVRFRDDGLAVEHWGVFDALTMMQQLGLAPEEPPTA